MRPLSEKIFSRQSEGAAEFPLEPPSAAPEPSAGAKRRWSVSFKKGSRKGYNFTAANKVSEGEGGIPLRSIS